MVDSPESTHQAMTTESTSSEDSTNPHTQEHQEHHQSEATDTHSPSQLGDLDRPLSPGLTIDDALSYLDVIKAKSDLEIYNNFLQIMKDFKNGDGDSPSTFRRVSTLLHEYPELLAGFHRFLHPSYLSSGAMNNLGWVEADMAGKELEDTTGCHLAGGETVDTQAETTSSTIPCFPGSEIPTSVGRWEDSAQTQIADSLSSSMTGLQRLQEVCQGAVGDNFVGSSTT